MREPFSVAMCVYKNDNAEHFDVAINSLLIQTVRPQEIVLVVDGPIPFEIEIIINKYRDQLKDSDISFRIIRFKDNKGHGETRRVGIEKCSFRFIALMDSDDISVPDRFESQLDFLDKHPDVSVVGGYINEFLTQNDANDVSHPAGSRVVPETDVEIKNYMKKRCPMNQVTVMFNKNDIQTVGGYIDWYCDEDYYLWVRLAMAKKKFGNLAKTLVNVRVGNEMYRRRGGIKYFRSESKLQKYMLKNGVISYPRYLINVTERFIIQVLMPSSIRGVVFRVFARRRVM